MFQCFCVLKAYKYCIKPTPEQVAQIEQHFGAVRYVYNWGLEQKINSYQTTSKSIRCFALMNKLTQLKKQAAFQWLNEAYSQSLQKSLANLDDAFTRFFKEKKGFPKFKSKKNPRQSYQISQGVKIDFASWTMQIPKLGKVAFHKDRVFEGKVKTCTISRNPVGKYFLSVLVESEQELIAKKQPELDNTLGIDLGIKDFAILSSGEKVANPKFLTNKLARLSVKQRQLSRKKLGSRNRLEAKRAVAKLHEKVANQRNHFLHRLSHRLTHDNQVELIGLETLKVGNMIKNHKLSRAIADVSWSQFVEMVKYKSQWYGKNLVQIGQFEPSSRLCNVCGYHNKDLTLSIRQWLCPKCSTILDRDLNAAVNIQKMSFQTFLRAGGQRCEVK